MEKNLERIFIKGLHGNRNIDVQMKDNTLILVGENGSGKTTFLRILFHLLSGRWFSLAQYPFEAISVWISGKESTISRDLITKALERPDRALLKHFPPPMRDQVREMIASGNVEEINREMLKLSRRYGVPLEVMMTELQLDLFGDNPRGAQKDLQGIFNRIHDSINSQILYLPTYRRIERELGSIFEGIDSDDTRRGKLAFLRPRETGEAYIELVEFGMKDVQQALAGALDKLKEFARERLNNLTLKYLGDVVDREYLDVGMKEITDMSEDTIRAVLDRIDESILTPLHKVHLLEVINSARTNDKPDEHSKIICHYFLKLFRFQEDLKAKEKAISDFCALCSEYIVDKKFLYDSAGFSFSILPKDERNGTRKLELSDLSSGEKQIVSLFSHLYMSGRQSYFVLIDEPELSLSVPWQRRFLLDIRKGLFCDGLVAVTHSPFIYDNALRKYAHSLGEFVSF